MKPRVTEKTHIKTVGEKAFNAAYGRAMLEIKQDTRLIGLDKIRGAIAHETALRATGYEKRALTLPKTCGELSQEIQDICEEVFEKAIAAATPVAAA